MQVTTLGGLYYVPADASQHLLEAFGEGYAAVYRPEKWDDHFGSPPEQHQLIKKKKRNKKPLPSPRHARTASSSSSSRSAQEEEEEREKRLREGALKAYGGDLRKACWLLPPASDARC
jgi:hypothetical protein